MINDKRKEAIALKYDQKTSKAPVILAKGKGKTAENILEKAMELDIPVQRDESLAALLGQLDINQTIPEELYGAVAEVFAFIYKVDQDMNR
ncbi:EscU/YscU/HrcU family type III secretion system export apparatus switch protein [Peribacillus sp. NPDC096622]|uniref:EscU/YscU/HrcU family type III secretion system export apparatus switch protein n=1 Tax=Peribacillus sp. NPDC096622 TaxID=3364396 RepID=UPI0026FC75DF|nr:EscU/YscU/HrcU family type III secretion system export apparatus switch protein [Peribacillus frigoritolerans]